MYSNDILVYACGKTIYGENKYRLTNKAIKPLNKQ